MDLSKPEPGELIVQPCEFWFIWTKKGHVPRRTHNTELSADREVRRLAHKHPGQKFIVLKSLIKMHTLKDKA